MEYVIVGNGIAAQSAIKAIRENDQQNKIIVISDEPFVNYSRPLISYLLAKQVKRKNMPYYDEVFYKENKAELILGKKAVKIELQAHIVLLDNGKKVNFDKLLIANGGIPIIPKIKGIDSCGVFNLLKLSDAEGISGYIRKNKVKKAVIIGGGLIGLKTTEALMKLDIEIAIVELADRILSASFNKEASSIIENALKKENCHLYFNNTVEEIKQENGRINEVILNDSRKILTDLVIVSIGVRPNEELVKNTVIKHKNGIMVNRFMETNIRNIYAAGDCCLAKDLFSNKNRSIAIWPVAAKQGKYAGYNLSGKKKPYPGGFPMNSVELCGIPAISVGVSNPPDMNYEIIDEIKPKKSIYRKMVIKDNQLKGFVLIGEIDRAGLYTGLIKEKIDVSSMKSALLKKDFGLLSLPIDYRKYLITEKEVSLNVY